MTNRLLLDEMYSPLIAQQLTERGPDVKSVAAGPRLAGTSDPEIADHAIAAGRCLLTENIADFETIRRHAAAEGKPCPGLLYATPKQFPRNRRFIATIVTALDAVLTNENLPGPGETTWLIKPT